MTVRKGILLLAYPGKNDTWIPEQAPTVMVHKNYPNSYYYSYTLPGLSDDHSTDKQSTRWVVFTELR